MSTNHLPTLAEKVAAFQKRMPTNLAAVRKTECSGSYISGVASALCLVVNEKFSPEERERAIRGWIEEIRAFSIALGLDGCDL